jgi:hypothetical protein
MTDALELGREATAGVEASSGSAKSAIVSVLAAGEFDRLQPPAVIRPGAMRMSPAERVSRSAGPMGILGAPVSRP